MCPGPILGLERVNTVVSRRGLLRGAAALIGAPVLLSIPGSADSSALWTPDNDNSIVIESLRDRDNIIELSLKRLSGKYPIASWVITPGQELIRYVSMPGYAIPVDHDTDIINIEVVAQTRHKNSFYAQRLVQGPSNAVKMRT